MGDHVYALLLRHPHTTVIWAHTGLGRFVKPSKVHMTCLGKVLDNCPNAYFDISWSEVAKTITEKDQTLKEWSELICQYPDRFFFGTDSVGPSREKYETEVHMYDKLWRILPKDVQAQVRSGNHDRIFDEANRKVRAWERKNLKVLVPVLNWPFANEKR